jgi:hypothetical protein
MTGSTGVACGYRAYEREAGWPVVSDSSVIARTGVLTVSTRGRRGPGEALVGIRGGSEW